MKTRKYIMPGTKVGLKLTAAERKLILKDLICQDDNYIQVIRDTPTSQPVQFTLDDWDGLSGYIAAEANHAEDKNLEKKLDGLFGKVQNILDTHTDEEPPKTVKIEDTDKATAFSNQAVEIAEWVALALAGAEKMGIMKKPLAHLLLSPADRAVLRLVPDFSTTSKKKLTKSDSEYTFAEVAGMAMALAETLPDCDEMKQVVTLLVTRHLMEHLQLAFGPAQPKGKAPKPSKQKPPTGQVFQIKIMLKDVEPPIWRRIQTKDCTLDKLHEHIQTAMGWTNSHLHQFKIDCVFYGDPQLLYEGWEGEKPPVNSLRTKLSKIIPKDGKRFHFEYEYDFGDGWEHEILFEGFLPAENGARYPLCIEGERACPPEDVGGSHSYPEYLEAVSNPKHKRHKEFIRWNGFFDPEKFDAPTATKAMQKGVFDWRNEQPI